MSENHEILIAKYFAGDASDAEQKRIEEWIGQSEENRKEFERYRLLWEKTMNAASYSDEQVETALKNTKKHIQEFRKGRMLMWLRQVAAVLVVSLLLSSIYNYLIIGRALEGRAKQVAMQEITARNGMATKVDLPDGSTVCLFPGSKLSFPVVFAGKTREVHLSGEGYFDVTHNEELPFVVKTNIINIKVLGTKFEVKANAGEDLLETVLVEGKIRLEKEVEGKAVKLKTLKPDQHAVYIPSKDKLEVFKEKDMNKHIGWVNGDLVFDADPMKDVIQKLEKWYNVDIEIKDNRLKKYKLTGTFNGETLKEVLALLQYSSDFKYRITERKIENGNYIKRKVILYK